MAVVESLAALRRPAVERFHCITKDDTYVYTYSIQTVMGIVSCSH